MKKNTYSIKGPKGVTLIELTVVIAIILVLISVLFIGAAYFRNSANRAACITNLSNLQKGMRAIQNEQNLEAGDAVAFIGPGLPLAAAPECPGDGTYTIGTTATAPGAAIATCSSTTGGAHAPEAATLATW